MTELEQLRKEINELRERVAVLEKRLVTQHIIGPATAYPATNQRYIPPTFVPQQGINTPQWPRDPIPFNPIGNIS